MTLERNNSGTAACRRHCESEERAAAEAEVDEQELRMVRAVVAQALAGPADAVGRIPFADGSFMLSAARRGRSGCSARRGGGSPG